MTIKQMENMIRKYLKDSPIIHQDDGLLLSQGFDSKSGAGVNYLYRLVDDQLIVEKMLGTSVVRKIDIKSAQYVLAIAAAAIFIDEATPTDEELAEVDDIIETGDVDKYLEPDTEKEEAGVATISEWTKRMLQSTQSNLCIDVTWEVTVSTLRTTTYGMVVKIRYNPADIINAVIKKVPHVGGFMTWSVKTNGKSSASLSCSLITTEDGKSASISMPKHMKTIYTMFEGAVKYRATHEVKDLALKVVPMVEKAIGINRRKHE